MKILITNNGEGHTTYRKMSEKPATELRKLGHTVVTSIPQNIGQDLTIILGYSASWEQIKDFPGQKIWWCHGANWSTHSNYKKDNEKVWDLIRNCNSVCYQSVFASHMAQKYLEYNRVGDIVLNSEHIMLPEKDKIIEGNVVNIATAAIWREWKRLPQMEEVITILNKIQKDKTFNLHVYGRDSKEKKFFDNEYIHYLGMSDNFPEAKDFHIYMQLSFNDFSPATVGEFSARGLPVVCSNSGGSKDLLGNSGKVVDIDPYIDYSINTYKNIPQIELMKVVNEILDMVNNYDKYYQLNKLRVLSVANAEYSAKQLINLYNQKYAY